jgi:hypothetical protein
MHLILLKTRTNLAPFPNKARGRVKPTALSSHPKHRHDWYKSTRVWRGFSLHLFA